MGTRLVPRYDRSDLGEATTSSSARTSQRGRMPVAPSEEEFYDMPLAPPEDEDDLDLGPAPIVPTLPPCEPWWPSEPLTSSAAIPTQHSREECVVCLAAFQADDQVSRLRCGHVFHGECISGWIARFEALSLRAQCESGG